MTRTLIDTDDELLERARVLLGTGTKKDTVNAALAQVVALDARRQFLDDARAGALGDATDDKVVDRAWRQYCGIWPTRVRCRALTVQSLTPRSPL